MQGLAYSVSGSWSSTPIDHPGLFVGGGETANIAEFLRLLKAAFQVLAFPQLHVFNNVQLCRTGWHVACCGVLHTQSRNRVISVLPCPLELMLHYLTSPQGLARSLFISGSSQDSAC